MPASSGEQGPGETTSRLGASRSISARVTWSLPPFATLGEAVEALRELRVPGLLVVDHDLELRGVISSADLRRMGVPDDTLAG